MHDCERFQFLFKYLKHFMKKKKVHIQKNPFPHAIRYSSLKIFVEDADFRLDIKCPRAMPENSYKKYNK